MINHPMFPRGNIYLSGGMEHSKDLGAGWRAEVSGVLRGMGYFPLDITALDKKYQAKYGDVYHLNMDAGGDELSTLQRKANIRKHFIHADLELIKHDSDALIVFYDESVRKGAGTISECQTAYSLDIPIFIVSDWENWEKEIPGWLLALSTKVFTQFDDLFVYLHNLPVGILKADMYGNRGTDEYYLCSLSGEPFKKFGSHFVSKVSPLYSKESVEVVRDTNEQMKDRYEFFIEYFNDLIERNG